METAVLSVSHKKKTSILDRSSAAVVKEEAKVKDEKAEKDNEEEMEVDSTHAATVVADSATAMLAATASNSEHKLAESKKYVCDI